MSAIQKKKKKRNSRFKKNTPCPVLMERQRQAARLLYDDEPVQSVAAALGVNRSTVWRWRKAKAFRLEWQRLDHNFQRRCKRLSEKLIAEREAEAAQWQELVRICEEKLDKEASKITSKPTNAFNKAYKDYEKALFHGYTLSEAIDILFNNKPIKLNRRG